MPKSYVTASEKYNSFVLTKYLNKHIVDKEHPLPFHY